MAKGGERSTTSHTISILQHFHIGSFTIDERSVKHLQPTKEREDTEPKKKERKEEKREDLTFTPRHRRCQHQK